VVVKRHSPFATTIDRLEVSITGAALTRMPAQVQVVSGGSATGAGRQIRIIDLILHVEDMQVGALPIESADFHGHELRVPLDRISQGSLAVASAQSLTGSVTCTEGGLGGFLRTRTLPIDAPEVRVTPGGCSLSGQTQSFIGLPVEVSGILIARDGAVLYLLHPELHVSIVAMPSFVRNAVLKKMNPLVDLNAALKLPAPAVITRIAHLDGALRFDAELRLPAPKREEP